MEPRLKYRERSPLLMEMGMLITYKLLKRSSFDNHPSDTKM
jgi:hypothetical protein